MKKINVFSEFVVFFMIFNVFMLGNRFYRKEKPAACGLLRYWRHRRSSRMIPSFPASEISLSSEIFFFLCRPGIKASFRFSDGKAKLLFIDFQRKRRYLPREIE